MKQITIHRGRTKVIVVSLGQDLRDQIIISEIRETSNPKSRLIATWDSFKINDGIDGDVRFSLDNAITAMITDLVGYMDILRIDGGEPYSVLEAPIPVLFTDMPTLAPEDPSV